jgi:hypothetical protein
MTATSVPFTLSLPLDLLFISQSTSSERRRRCRFVFVRICHSFSFASIYISSPSSWSTAVNSHATWASRSLSLRLCLRLSLFLFRFHSILHFIAKLIVKCNVCPFHFFVSTPRSSSVEMYSHATLSHFLFGFQLLLHFITKVIVDCYVLACNLRAVALSMPVSFTLSLSAPLALTFHHQADCRLQCIPMQLLHTFSLASNCSYIYYHREFDPVENVSSAGLLVRSSVGSPGGS